MAIYKYSVVSQTTFTTSSLLIAAHVFNGVLYILYSNNIAYDGLVHVAHWNGASWVDDVSADCGVHYEIRQNYTWNNGILIGGYVYSMTFIPATGYIGGDNTNNRGLIKWNPTSVTQVNRFDAVDTGSKIFYDVAGTMYYKDVAASSYRSVTTGGIPTLLGSPVIPDYYCRATSIDGTIFGINYPSDPSVNKNTTDTFYIKDAAGIRTGTYSNPAVTHGYVGVNATFDDVNCILYIISQTEYQFSAATVINVIQMSKAIATPSPTIISVSNIKGITANGIGASIDQGQAAVSDFGFCWNLTGSPTLADNSSHGVGDINRFVAPITGLAPLTQNYTCSYATNAYGTGYSPQGDFMTYSSLATVTTAAASNVGATTAVCGGNVAAQGDGTVTDCGICWDTLPNPMIATNVLSMGSGLGAFSGTISGLFPGTKYYLRAYAISEYGTSYGNQITLTTTRPVRTSKILRRVLQNLKDTGQHELKIDDELIDRLNIIQKELCRDYFALKGTDTISIIAGTSIYPIDTTVYKILQIYTPITSPQSPVIDIIHDNTKWAELKNDPYIHSCRKCFAHLWNGSLEIYPTPNWSSTYNFDAYMLPSQDIPSSLDPEIDSQWDTALEYGVTSAFDADWFPRYQFEAQNRMQQNIKESIQGVQRIDYSEQNIWCL
jgi:hypothetical protein